jgi:hypothetical protein
MLEHLNLPIINSSVVVSHGTTYSLVAAEGGNTRKLLISGDTSGFVGKRLNAGELLCALTSENAVVLRQRLPWLQPVLLGLQTSAGFGDRLGLATPGHIQAVRRGCAAPIFAQQSVRENTRTGRTPQQVIDDAMWGVLEAGWSAPWGADADHLKTLDDIDPFVAAGYTFYTIDPGDHVDDAAEKDPLPTLYQKIYRLPWDDLQSTLQDTVARYLKSFELDDRVLTFDEHTLLKAVAKYGAAVAHTVRMARKLQQLARTFELEMSVDETNSTTSIHEHFYIASELRRLQVPLVSLAPRFVGRFEKGVDYIGDLQELDRNIAEHAAVMRHFGNSYKLSLHTGSDKFGVYPLAMKHTGGLVHLKTAGTSYLEALHMISSVDPAFFRTLFDFARGHYTTDRLTYHVSAELSKLPDIASLSDEQLPSLFEQFDARQVLHVTFGSVLDTYGTRLHQVLAENQALYHSYIKRHFDKHLRALSL